MHVPELSLASYNQQHLNFRMSTLPLLALTSPTWNEMLEDGESQLQPQPQSQAHPSRGASRARRGRGRGGRGREPATHGSSQRPRGHGPSQNIHENVDTAPLAAAVASEDQASPSAAPLARHTRGSRGRRGQRPAERNGTNARTSQPAPSRSFGGHLTAASEESTTAHSLSAGAAVFVPGQPVATRPRRAGSSRAHNLPQVRLPKSTAADLGTRIHEDISNGNYECAVCTDEILRASHMWSCSICWTVVHLKCAKKWHHNQMQQQSNTQSTEPRTEIAWRCPGCNSKLADDPGSYHCWCGKDISPKPSSASLPPHSCGQTCSKPRATCPHPCPLQCHAGPCPPCDLMGPAQSCFCGKNSSRKLCRETDYENGWSCQEICGDLLPCGDHFCPKPCHSGLCGACDMKVDAKCYCGRLEKTIPCFERGDPEKSYDWRESTWFEGSFNCLQVCDRKFNCNFHSCLETCHPEKEHPARCPFSPDAVTHCPCGKTTLSDFLENPRESCQDAIPHCEKICEKLLPCGHICKAKCHIGDCGSCEEMVDISCRCGRVVSPSVCYRGDFQKPWCTRICQANLSCGRHICGDHCCPGEKKAAERLAARKKNRFQAPETSVEAEHICIRTCGRPLKCGSHNCQQICHRGACGACLEAIFHEISCDCGRTVLQPPQPCGTRAPECRFNCSRRPACGHPPVEHNCHGDDAACPKCPFLVDKWCACGKEKLKSQPCHIQAARCGRPCKKELKCGVHLCRKLCHKPGECEDGPGSGQTCSQVCGKTKLFCDHPCQSQCHGHSACNESAACSMKAIVSCPCGLRQQEVKCLASSSNPTPTRPEMKCDDECLRLDRNRRLASALNIDPASHTNDHVPYSDTTLKLFRENPSWAETQEREFRVFSKSATEVRLRYKPMASPQRQFLHSLAGDYGLESKSEDVEPQRYVLIWKGQKFASAPSKTLAQCIKIRDAQEAAAAAEAAGAQGGASPLPFMVNEPFNAFLLTAPRFGLTTEDVEAALRADLASHSSFTFTTTFLPAGEEFLITATAHYSSFLTPSTIEQALSSMKPRLAETIKRQDIVGSILLCHVNDNDEVSRRENISKTDASSGWSAVAGRAAAKSQDSKVDALGATAGASGRRMLGLRKKGVENKGKEKLWTSQLGGDTEC